MKILSTTESLIRIIDTISLYERVFFTRYGDNDIMMMSGTDLYGKKLGNKRYGGNRTLWTPELQKEMQESFTIKDPRFLKGVSASWDKEPGMRDGLFANFNYKGKLETKIAQFTDEQEFLIPILFHYLITFKPELFDLFINKYVRHHKILFIGSVKKETAEKVLGKVDYVKTPAHGAYETIDKWWVNVLKALEKEPKVIIPCCGQASRIIQKRLWEMDLNVWSFDLGSMFDPIEDNNSRTCWRMMGARIKQRYV